MLPVAKNMRITRIIATTISGGSQALLRFGAAFKRSVLLSLILGPCLALCIALAH